MVITFLDGNLLSAPEVNIDFVVSVILVFFALIFRIHNLKKIMNRFVKIIAVACCVEIGRAHV